jgi:hypothetical protein
LIFIFRNIIKTLLLALRYSFIVNSQHYIFNRNSALQFFVDAMLWSPISHQFLVAADSRDLTFWYEIEWREERLYWFSLLSLSLSLSISFTVHILLATHEIFYFALFSLSPFRLFGPITSNWKSLFFIQYMLKKYFFEFNISCVA